MLLGKTPRRIIAATLLTIFATETFAPGICYALTSGPTQPEANSFEPVDTTDMVNLQSGDFTYNIPILDVPGPDGDYPLALSYHAGVHTNDDATWVGLGWSLNPGAVNRTVSGLPDDWKGITNGTQAYWKGGQTSTYGVGVTIGDANSPDNVSFGLEMANDTYKGFSLGYSISAGPLSYGEGLYDKSPSLKLGIPLYGMSGNGANLHLGMSLSTNFKSLSAGFTMGVQGGSAMGSISSDGNSSASAGWNVGGTSAFVHNSKTNLLQTSSWGINNLPIPIVPGLSLNLTFSKKRYWINTTTSMYADGTLYQNFSNVEGKDVVYDNYSLLDDPNSYNIYEYPDPTILQGGAFPDFDNYSVASQGLSGSMRPYFFQGQLMGQERDNTNTVTKWYDNSQGGPRGWRFEGDFSNSFRQNSLSAGSTDYYYDANDLATAPSTNTTPPFDPNPLFGNTVGQQDYGNGTMTNNYGANINGGTNPQYISLAGSRHIDMLWITPVNCPGSVGVPAGGMIPGFSITNESGVTYHYGLAAYSNNEESYQEKIDHSQGLMFNRNTKGGGYAYTWYLTSITGSDFVDRNGDGHADAGDWGYWVNFEYGKWTGGYVWRNPVYGFHRDEDNRYQDCSMGERDVFYLNAIRTATHIAIFEKDVRNDAKSEAPEIFNKNNTNQDYSEPGAFNLNSVQSMQLSHIYLLPIADANLVPTDAGNSNTISPPGGPNVIDRTDVDAVGRSMLESNALRVIDFNYDYSLCPNTMNSFAFTAGTGLVGPLTGKLTLKAVTTRGKGGASVMPATQFSYDLPADQLKSASGTVGPTSFTTSNPVFQVGDMLQSNGVYYGVITAPYQNGAYTLGNSSMASNASPVSVVMTNTKNPPFNYQAYDMWGMYKSDYDPVALAGDENLGRNTTAISAPGTDAWSLRTVTTPLGDQIEVKYDPDSYHTVAVDNTPSLVMSNIKYISGGNNPVITFQLANSGPLTNPGAIIQQGTTFPRVLLLMDATWTGGSYIKSPQPLTSMTISNISGSGSSAVYTGVLGGPIVSTTFTGTIWTGNLYVDQASDFYGGGIRVASLAVNHTFDNSVSKVSYSYNTPGTSFSSGTTSYLPTVLDAYDAKMVDSVPPGRTYAAGVDADLYQKALYQNVSGLYPIIRDLPPPGVIYQYVTETDQYTNAVSDENGVQRTVPGSTQYQFDVFQPYMVGREVVDPSNPVVQGTQATGRNWALRVFTGNEGNLKSITQYDAQGNMLKQTVNHYLHDGINTTDFHTFMTQYLGLLNTYHYQGLIEERYSELKSIPFNDPSVTQSQTLGGNKQVYGNMATMITREVYPCIQTSQSVTDYAKGVTTSTQNLAFDFYSGAVTEKLATDAYGNNFMTVTTPAYQEYSTMGLKINTDGNLNMLTQTAEVKTYKVDASNNPTGLVSAEVTTWSNGFTALDADGTQHVEAGGTEPINGLTVSKGNVWRPQSTYDWMPPSTTQSTDGLTPIASFSGSDFNFTTPSSSDSRWVNTSTHTLYDVFSKSLEDVDVDGNYSATHMSYGENRVILTGGPANYYEIAYSGAEDGAITNPSTSFITAQAGTVTTAAEHTGAQSLLVNPGSNTGFLYTAPIVNSGNGGVLVNRNYIASVWVKPVSGTATNVNIYYQVNGVTQTANASSSNSNKTAGGWTQVNLLIPGSTLSAGTLKVWCENDHASVAAYLDDFRFQPQNATTTAYVYDPFSGELTYTLDNSNLYTRFQYDAAGQLVDIYKEKLSLGEFKTNQYQYNYGAPKYGNDPINNGNFSKNNCPFNEGYVGTSSSVTIAGSTYYSFISTADADARANTYAQDYANTHGTCVCTPGFQAASPNMYTLNNFTQSPNGTRNTLTLDFNNNVGNTDIIIGGITGSCIYPTATRTVPVYDVYTGITWNMTINNAGTIELVYQSGPAPGNGEIRVSGTYDQLVDLFYNNVFTVTAYSQSCPAGETDPTGISITSLPDQFCGTTAQDAYNQAYNYYFGLAQNQANGDGCVIQCGFGYNNSLVTGYTGVNSTISVASDNNTATFTFTFTANADNFSDGIIGTITGCTPSKQQVISVADNTDTGRMWQIFINTNGTVEASVSSGPAVNASDPAVTITGNYTLH